MAQTANRIHAQGPFVYQEYVAGEADILPGMLLKVNSDNQVIKHDVEGGDLGDGIIVAVEDALQGKTVDDVATLGDVIPVMILNKGSAVRLLTEDGQDVAIGSKVMSAGNGKVKVTTDIESGDTLSVVAGIATEENDLTGSNTSDTLSIYRVP